jgi:hypothetical protein
MHASKDALEGFLLCNTPSELERFRKGSNVSVAKENKGFFNRSRGEKTHHIPLRNNVARSPGVRGDYWT